jgi:hypothetical protein
MFALIVTTGVLGLALRPCPAQSGAEKAPAGPAKMSLTESHE